MTTTATRPAGAAGVRTPTQRPTRRAHPAPRLTTGRAIRHEWIKLTSLRSTWITLVAVVLVVAGFGIAATTVGAHDDLSGLSGADALQSTLIGMSLGVLVVGALGAIVGAREFGSGMIRTTLAVVPRRGLVLVARTVALLALLVPTLVVAVGLAVGVGGHLLAGAGAPTLPLTDPVTLQVVGGSVLYLTVVALLGLAFGIIVRNVAGAITTVVGVLFLLPGLVGAVLPDSAAHLLAYLPSTAGSAVSSAAPAAAGALSAGTAAVALVGWAVVALAGAGIALSRRDA